MSAKKESCIEKLLLPSSLKEDDISIDEKDLEELLSEEEEVNTNKKQVNNNIKKYYFLILEFKSNNNIQMFGRL